MYFAVKRILDKQDGKSWIGLSRWTDAYIDGIICFQILHTINPFIAKRFSVCIKHVTMYDGTA